MLKRLLAAVVLVGLLWPAHVQAQSYTLSPPPFLLAQNNSGAVINNACVWTYTAGTTTPATTYSDNAGTANQNPIRSDPAGRFTAYLVAGQSYKFVYEAACTPPAHGTVLRTADNVSAVPSSSATVDVTGVAGETISAGNCAYLSDGSGSKTAGQFFKCDSTNTYSSTTPTLGLAPSAIASGASGVIRIFGTVTGLSVSVGSSYYVGSSGAITTTAPTFARLLGVADSATSLIVTPARAVLPAGTVALPGLSVLGDPDTGLYASGANALELATGGVKALGIDSTQFIDSPTQPRAKVYKAAAQTLSNNTETVLTFDTETYDVGAMHSTVSNTNRITVPTGGDGLYLVAAAVQFTGNATGLRRVTIYNNSGSIIGGNWTDSPGANTLVLPSAPCVVVLAAGDWVEVRATQASGGNLDVGGDGGALEWFEVVKLW